MRGVRIRGVRMRGARIRGVRIRGVRIRGARIQGARIRGASIRGTCTSVRPVHCGETCQGQCHVRAVRIHGAAEQRLVQGLVRLRRGQRRRTRQLDADDAALRKDAKAFKQLGDLQERRIGADGWRHARALVPVHAANVHAVERRRRQRHCSCNHARVVAPRGVAIRLAAPAHARRRRGVHAIQHVGHVESRRDADASRRSGRRGSARRRATRQCRRDVIALCDARSGVHVSCIGLGRRARCVHCTSRRCVRRCVRRCRVNVSACTVRRCGIFSCGILFCGIRMRVGRLCWGHCPGRRPRRQWRGQRCAIGSGRALRGAPWGHARCERRVLRRGCNSSGRRLGHRVDGCDRRRDCRRGRRRLHWVTRRVG